jgi:alpha-L-fucosidase 2
MFDAHPPFQIDGNFGGGAGILELLLQSWGDELHVLPALPSAWPVGSITGFRARGGLSVDVAWRQGRATALGIRGPAGSTVRVRTGKQLFEATIPSSGLYSRRWA